MTGRFASIARDASGRPRSVIMVHATEFTCPGIRLRSERPVTLSAVFDGETIRMVSCPPVAYQTLEGRPVYKNGQDVDVCVELAPDGARAGRKIEARLPRQTETGPVPIEL